MADDTDPDRTAAELLKVFQPMIRFSGRLERGAVDLARPRTEIARLKKQIVSSLDRVEVATLVSGLRDLLCAITPEEITAALSELPPRPQRRRCEMLNAYLDLVERHAPFAIGIIYGGSKLFGLDFLSKTLEAFGKLRNAARGSGETRIEALRIAAGFILESHYKELATVLYEIECLRRSRPITVGLEFGNLVENVAHSTRDLLPAFVDRHTARMRNAAYHDRWCQREDGSGVIDLHDTESALRGLTPPQIYGRLRDYYRDVQDLTHCLIWRATASLLLLYSRPPLNVALAAACGGKPHDPSLADAVGAVLAGAMGGAWTRLDTVNWIPRNQAVPPTAA
jgi:hypothetical protein